MLSTPGRPEAVVVPAAVAGKGGEAARGTRLLEVSGLTVDFVDPGGERTNRVVDDVSFSVGHGERLALVGESGSGKTVTAQAILRLHDNARYGGSIRFEGRDLLAASDTQMRAVRGREIAMIFQEPMAALNPLYSIGDQVSEVLVLHQAMTRPQARARAIELLDRTRIKEPQRRFDSLPHQLSGGQRQRAMIAMALACNPKLVIADEPTTALDVTVQAQIMALLAELQKEIGMAVLLITHDLPLVRSFASRVGVMRAGRILERGPTADVFEAPVHEYTRRLVDARPQRMVTEMAEESATGAPVLKTRGLRCTFVTSAGWFRHHRFEALKGIDLSLPPGRTLGVVGESGSGKTTLAMTILRLVTGLTSGEVTVAGKRIDQLPERALRPHRRTFQMVFQDPYNSLSPRMTVGGIVGEALALHRPDLDPAARRAATAQALSEVGLDPDMSMRCPHEFSGGQRQRIAIARALVLKPTLLVLDEPTSALDLTVQRQVLELLVSLQQRHGLSYLLITHDLAVIRAMAHRVMVMKDGEVVEQGPVEQIFTAPADPYTRTLLSAVRQLE
ncbi:MAG: ABC transporter ATP-binding protein [Burkholderiaceae bacterium]|nr:ABC transporter ATP-binding protein [Burkholderiaceae bacterium]